MTDESIREVVIRAAEAGGDVANGYFRRGIASETKDGADRVINPSDVVTEADRLAQRRVIERIRQERPDGAIVGEEEDERKTVPNEGLAWVIDPIDGTYNYVRNMVNWATCVAAVRGSETIAAATILPAIGDAYVVDANGVRVGDRPISVSDRTDPATFLVSPIALPPYDRRGAYAAEIGEMFERFGDVRRIGSIQITLALIASGSLDGAVTASRTNPWDTIGGVAMIRRAGGTVTDVEGDPWMPDSRGLVASNGTAHGELLAIADQLDESRESR